MRRLLPILIAAVMLMCSASPGFAAPAHHRAAHGHAARWHKVFSGTFASGYSRKIWTRYGGTPRCCQATRWSRSHLVARRGVMSLETYRDPAFAGRWVSAGMSMGRSLNQTYGKWSVRFRMDTGGGIGMCMGLWPKNGWPPEIDFAEESSQYGHRGVETATLHYGAHNSQVRSRVAANFTKWHVISVAWTPHRLVYLLDGKRWGEVTGNPVPHQPMHLFIQTHVGSNGSGGVMPALTQSRHVGLHIDWVHVYRPTH